jgi:hypothetical protein
MSSVPPSESFRPVPRFRVVTRKPLVNAPGRRKPAAHHSLAMAVVPGIGLLIYVMFWTLALRGGYYKAQLQTQLAEIRTERRELAAEKRRLQAPGPLSQRAYELGMELPEQVDYIVPSGSKEVR